MFVTPHRMTDFEGENNLAIGFFYKNPSLRRNFEIEVNNYLIIILNLFNNIKNIYKIVCKY